jgi:hypothetical protein
VKSAASAFVLALAVGIPAPARAQSPADTSKAALDAKSEAALRERVLRWWHAREKRDHQTMYDLHEPAYRAKVGFADFTPESTVRSRFDISEPVVKEIVAESDTRARVRVEFRGMVSIIGQSFPSRLEDTWVKVEGEWFKVHTPTPKSILEPPKSER